MSFYDDLGEQLKQAELLLDAEAAQAAQTQASPARARRARRGRRSRLPRPVLLGGLALLLAGFVFVALSADRRTSMARAGLAIFETDAVATSGIKLRPQQVELSNATTAHPFDTPNGPGYAFLATRPNADETFVCVAVPDSPEASNEPLGSTCRERSDAEANGLVFALVPTAPARALDVVVLPIGTATALFTPADGGAPQTLPSVNGVVAFQPPSTGTISWKTADGRTVSEEVNRNFPESKLKFQCKDATVFYRAEKDPSLGRELCRGHNGVRATMGVPLSTPEDDARPENRSPLADGAPSTTP